MSQDIPNGMRIHNEIMQLAEGLLTSEAYFQFPGTTVVVCLLTTHHGHHEVGASFFPDPAEFNDELARQGSRRDAMEKLRPVANYLYREKQYLAGATLEPAVPVLDIQNVGMGYMAAHTPVSGGEMRMIVTGMLYAEMTIEELRKAYTEAFERLTALKQEPSGVVVPEAQRREREFLITSIGKRLDEIAAETSRRYGVKLEKAADSPLAEERLGQEADAQLAAEIETTRQSTAGAGEEQIAEIANILHKSDLITADEAARVSGETVDAFKRSDRERDSMVSGDGVELISIQHPSSVEDME